MASLAAAYAAAAAKKHAYAKPAFKAAPAKPKTRARSCAPFDLALGQAILSGYADIPDVPSNPLIEAAIAFDLSRHAHAIDKGLDEPVVNQARPNFKATRPGYPREVKQRFGQEPQTPLTDYYARKDMREPKFSGEGAEVSRLIVAPYEQFAIALTQWGNELKRQQRARRDAMLDMKTYNARAETSRQVMKGLMADFNS